MKQSVKKVEISIEDQPKWLACVSETMLKAMDDDNSGELTVGDLYKRCAENFKTNNYKLPKAAANKAKRAQIIKTREQKKATLGLQDPEKLAFIKKIMPQLKEENPGLGQKKLRELAIHMWCIERDSVPSIKPK